VHACERVTKTGGCGAEVLCECDAHRAGCNGSGLGMGLWITRTHARVIAADHCSGAR
jgi:hypothetical protein